MMHLIDWGVYAVNGREYRAVVDDGVAFLCARRTFDRGAHTGRPARYVLWSDGTVTLGRDYPQRDHPVRVSIEYVRRR